VSQIRTKNAKKWGVALLPKFGELDTPISINFPWFSAHFALNQHKSAMFRYSPFTDTATLISQYMSKGVSPSNSGTFNQGGGKTGVVAPDHQGT